jgi:glycosyltransferase involved in cell wall biosynthesis
MRVIHWYPNFLSGGAVAGSTARLALSQASAGAEVLVVAATEKEGKVLYGGREDAAAILQSWRPAWRLSAGGLVLRGVRRVDAQHLRAFVPDVVHAHGEFNPDNLWLPRIFRVPLVLSPRGAFHPMVFAKRKARAKRLYVSVAKRALYRRLAGFHATSPMEAEHIRATCPGVPVYVVPPGLQVSESAPRRPIPPPSSRAPVEIIFVGRLDVYTKGLDLLLDAFGEFARRSSYAAHLKLVGPDWHGGRRLIEERLSRLEVSGLVELVGEVTPDQVIDRLRSADISVQVSRHEGFSSSAAEALLVGKPLVMSSAVGLASYSEIASLPHVFVVRPEVDSIVGALSEVVERLDSLTRSASEARPHLESFLSLERTALEHLDFYSRVLGCRRQLPTA